MTLLKLSLAVFLFAVSLPANASSIYEGQWTFKSGSTKGGCKGAPGKVFVKGTRITGYVNSHSFGRLSISGQVFSDGRFKGLIGGGLASFKGSASGQAAKGTWKDIGRCGGNMTLRKL